MFTYTDFVIFPAVLEIFGTSGGYWNTLMVPVLTVSKFLGMSSL